MLDNEKCELYNSNKSQLRYATERKEANSMQEIKYAMSIEEASRLYRDRKKYNPKTYRMGKASGTPNRKKDCNKKRCT